MEPEKKEHKYLTVLITVLVMLLVTAAAVAGVWYYMDQQAKKTAEDNIEQVAELEKQDVNLNKTESTVNNSTTKNIYSSNFGKYNFVLPAGYVISEGIIGCEGLCTQEVTLSKKNDDNSSKSTGIVIQTINEGGTQNYSLAEMKKNIGEISKTEKVTIGGVAAEKLTVNGFGTITVYLFQKNNYLYKISYGQYGVSRDINQDSLMTQIISSFKFN